MDESCIRNTESHSLTSLDFGFPFLSQMKNTATGPVQPTENAENLHGIIYIIHVKTTRNC